jgi:hypothetical protein
MQAATVGSCSPTTVLKLKICFFVLATLLKFIFMRGTSVILLAAKSSSKVFEPSLF